MKCLFWVGFEKKHLRCSKAKALYRLEISYLLSCNKEYDKRPLRETQSWRRVDPTATALLIRHHKENICLRNSPGWKFLCKSTINLQHLCCKLKDGCYERHSMFPPGTQTKSFSKSFGRISIKGQLWKKKLHKPSKHFIQTLFNLPKDL